MDNIDFDLISLGDCTLDVYLELEEASVACDIKKEDCKLLLDYAEKIPVKSVTHVAGGGNAANNAVGSARLGLKTTLVSFVGNDQMGRHIQESLKAEGVDYRFLTIDSQNGTNYATILNYAGERTILVFHENRTYTLPALPEAKWVYFSSVPTGNKALYQDLLGYLDRTDAKLAFNPGTKQIREGLESLKHLLARVEVLFLNREEAVKLIGDNDDNWQLLEEFKALGPRIVVLTLGGKGALALSDSGRLEQKSLAGNVREKTGAGDAFATGTIAALSRGQELATALKWGTINAWSVLQYVGSHAGLLTEDRLNQILAEHPDL